MGSLALTSRSSDIKLVSISGDSLVRSNSKRLKSNQSLPVFHGSLSLTTLGNSAKGIYNALICGNVNIPTSVIRQFRNRISLWAEICAAQVNDNGGTNRYCSENKLSSQYSILP